MQKEIKDAWLIALRSGEYEQGFGRLRTHVTTNPSFCCLGVLACVLEKQFPEIVSSLTEPIDMTGGQFSEVLAGKMGLGGNQHTCILWNDVERYSFNKIADLIERKGF